MEHKTITLEHVRCKHCGAETVTVNGDGRCPKECPGWFDILGNYSQQIDIFERLQSPKEKAADLMFNALVSAQDILFKLHSTSEAFYKVESALSEAGDSR